MVGCPTWLPAPGLPEQQHPGIINSSMFWIMHGLVFVLGSSGLGLSGWPVRRRVQLFWGPCLPGCNNSLCHVPGSGW